MEEMVFALVPMTLFVSVAAVLIFRPLAKRLGDLLVHFQKDRQGARLDQNELGRLMALLEQMNGRLELMEERLDFAERLLSGGHRSHVPAETGPMPLRDGQPR